jgi:ribonuclease E
VIINVTPPGQTPATPPEFTSEVSTPERVSISESTTPERVSIPERVNIGVTPIKKVEPKVEPQPEPQPEPQLELFTENSTQPSGFATIVDETEANSAPVDKRRRRRRGSMDLDGSNDG